MTVLAVVLGGFLWGMLIFGVVGLIWRPLLIFGAIGLGVAMFAAKFPDAAKVIFIGGFAGLFTWGFIERCLKWTGYLPKRSLPPTRPVLPADQTPAAIAD